MILALDIGGTKVVVARFAMQGERLVAEGEPTRYLTRDYPGLSQLLAAELARYPARPQAIGIGVAGPVLGRSIKLTNLPWVIDLGEIEASFGCPAFALNDLAAYGYAIPHEDPRHLVALQPGVVRPGNIAIIAAGTGLGEALLFWDGREHLTSASEGGHASFSPTSDEEIELLRFVKERSRGGHVSWERLVSGLEGFRNIYDFLHDTGRIMVPEAQARELTARHDIGREILTAADAGEPFARRVLELFVRLYGVEAGNLALKAMALGGVYLAGGIAPRILPWLRSGDFVAAFREKGRFASLLADVPVHVLVDAGAPLRGAAHYALASLERKPKSVD